jgi:integrase
LVRPGEVAKAEWSEIDFGNRVWTIPAAKMKMRREHQVPLSQQALDVLTAVKAINGSRRHVFAIYEDKPLREIPSTPHCASWVTIPRTNIARMASAPPHQPS